MLLQLPRNSIDVLEYFTEYFPCLLYVYYIP